MAHFNLSQLAIFLVLAIVRGTLADPPERIVGGNIAARGEFPYQVSMKSDGDHICGGVLISNQHILTAAHCVDDTPLDTIEIVTGTVDLNYGGESHRVKHALVHPNFISNIVNNTGSDIAVLTLAEPIVPNAFQKPIPIASVDPLPDNAKAVLSGFGRVQVRTPRNAFLRKVEMTIFSPERCQKYHKKHIYSNQFCAFNKINIGACMGDSGGPLVYNGEVVGIVSIVRPCARGIPDIYTKVYSFRDFINKAILRR